MDSTGNKQEKPSPTDRRAAPLPKAIWALGLVSLLMDVSSELIHSLLPMFMVTALGASAFTIGLVDGIGEATALIVKMFSGPLSDRWGRRKPLAVFGYGLGAVSKPLFALASSTGLVLIARFIDRIGKGLRGAPRDALVADLAPPSMRGAAFGLRQSLDTVGAFLGPALGIALMLVWHDDFRLAFLVAVVPGMASVALLLFGVQEPTRPPVERPINPISLRQLRRLPKRYWWVVAVSGAFTLARFSEAFLVLKARQSGLAIAWTPMVLIAMNIVYSMAAYPFGKLSDRMSHVRLLVIGVCVLFVADVVLATAATVPIIALGILLWGLHMGVTQGLLATIVAETAPAELRGTAFGLFNLVSGIAMLMGSVIAGTLWDRVGAVATFGLGATFCAGTIAVIGLRPRE